MQNYQTNIFDETDEIVPIDQLESEEDVNFEKKDVPKAVLFNTDWTVETLYRQIKKGNIELDPKFQRRDAWDAARKSKLMESIICGFPIPNVVLAEDQNNKGKYLVIDGKQRLSTIFNFIRGDFLLSGLKILDNLNGKNYAQLEKDDAEIINIIENQTIRTVIIRNWPNEAYLYTVFHRLNSGSLPLSTQELRKALHGGKLLDHIDDFIKNSNAYHIIFGDKIDRRMRDVELILRYVAFERFYKNYKGDLKSFLDEVVISYDKNWEIEISKLNIDLAKLDNALKITHQIFGENSFKKWNGTSFEKRINRGIFDALTRYFGDSNFNSKFISEKNKIIDEFKVLCSDQDFKNAIERSTKLSSATKLRYRLVGSKLANIADSDLDEENMRIIS
jgi:hypothetical protein